MDETNANFDSESELSRIVAVIDIGATSVRMMVAEIYSDNTIQELESLSQAVQLGRDTFTDGAISRATTEDCVHVLRVYRDKLREYGISTLDNVRVVATSAVREARNSLAFQDRIYVATGIAIEPFDEASLHRTTFIGIKPVLDQYDQLKSGQTIVCEVGGGSTEVLFMNEGQVTFAKTYRLGALRLARSLEPFQGSLSRTYDLMESQIDQTANQILSVANESLPQRQPDNQPPARQLLVMGGEMRLAAEQTAPDDADDELIRIQIEHLKAFTDETASLSVEELVQRYQLSMNEALSLAPALLINLHLAQTLGVQELLVAQVNLREGLIGDLLLGDRWIGQTDSHLLDAAMAFGRRFHIDEAHARHVEFLSNEIFVQTRSLHKLGHRWQLLLRMAATLHEVGLAISEQSYHKHSMYIIRNASFFGLGSSDIDRVALIARYHRRALPEPRHAAFSELDREARVNISKLAAILRVAKALDASRNQRICEIDCRPMRGSTNQLRIHVPGIADISLEQLVLKRQGVLFENIFGVRPELTRAASDPDDSGLARERN